MMGTDTTPIPVSVGTPAKTNRRGDKIRDDGSDESQLPVLLQYKI